MPIESSPPAPARDPTRERAYENLRQWRRETADAMHVPPYFLFPDRTLSAIVDAWPLTREDLARVNGVGPAKLSQYGEPILRRLAALPTPPALPEVTHPLPPALQRELDAAAREDGRAGADLLALAVRCFLAIRRETRAVPTRVRARG